jgi:hypothetical protein
LLSATNVYFEDEPGGGAAVVLFYRNPNPLQKILAEDFRRLGNCACVIGVRSVLAALRSKDQENWHPI